MVETCALPAQQSIELRGSDKRLVAACYAKLPKVGFLHFASLQQAHLAALGNIVVIAYGIDFQLFRIRKQITRNIPKGLRRIPCIYTPKKQAFTLLFDTQIQYYFVGVFDTFQQGVFGEVFECSDFLHQINGKIACSQRVVAPNQALIVNQYFFYFPAFKLDFPLAVYRYSGQLSEQIFYGTFGTIYESVHLINRGISPFYNS